ncbi:MULTISPECIES: dicarboxylate/amino acid:cation symporter [Pandoraea]|uniref:dicarboxylate/amino acid:cation symporter n=1 Tax=Pandoraea TaxID=93217 RepID=UPI001F5D9614|nr:MULTISPECIES: dicarboxylate/amino acid:cation symporter [Pandoraea]MCI3206719.1 C4-dicarboxylate transporter DctA [Pandoraea sp. LA3]MDN4584747.1 C4-dicarboxylate transporter DctA [Pandoraea capi]
MTKPLHRQLYVQVLAAITAGILLGHFWPALAIDMKPLGDAFIKLIKMIIGPVIFCTVVSGIAGVGDLKKIGRVGGKALIYFEVVSTFALVLGLLATHLFRPGAGLDIDPATLDSKAVAAYANVAHEQTTVGFLMHIIPDTLVSAFARGEILQILLVSMLFGVVLAHGGERGQVFTRFVDSVSHVLFGIVHMITRLAPIGAFGAIAFTIGKYGVGSLLPMLKLIGTFYLTAAVFVIVVLGGIARLIGVNIFRLLAYFREELLIVLGTSSGEPVLPLLLRKLERLGCARPVVGLVIPTGYSFNLDGTNIYMTMGVLFIAQATNIELTWAQQLTILAVAMVTSKGASGVTGAAFVTLAATLAVVPGVPVAGLVLILGINRFMSEVVALTNVIGNTVATLAIAAWEGELDRDRLHAELAGHRLTTDPDAENIAPAAASTTHAPKLGAGLSESVN